MAYNYPSDSPTANKARLLCQRAIERYAPVWLSPGLNAQNSINPTEAGAPDTFAVEEDVAEALPAEFLGDITEPDYMQGLTEAEKNHVRKVAGEPETKRKYANDLKRWRSPHSPEQG